MTLTTLTLPFPHLKSLIVSALGFEELESEDMNMPNIVALMEALGHIRIDATGERFSWTRHALNEYELIDIFSDAYVANQRKYS